MLSGRPEESLVRFRIRATGEERWSIVLATPVLDAEGQTQFVVSSFHDVTALKVSEERLALLADAGAVLGRSTDYQETLNELARLIVPLFADWCVVDVAETGSGVRRIAVAHAEPLITDEQIAESARDAEHLGYLHKLGIRSAALLPLSARGTVLGVLTLIRSDPARGFHEDEMPLLRELAGRAALAVDNARLLHDATEAVRLRDDFLAIASHDMRTPLAAVLGYVELARRRSVRGGGDAKLVEYLDAAHRMTGRLTELVGDLLDLSLLSSGRPLALEQEPLDLRTMSAQVVEEHRRLHTTHAFTLAAPEVPVTVRSDARRLQRVLDNLLSNAVKYSPDGGTITVRVANDGETASIAVTDEGIGIPEHDLPHLFARYARGSNAGVVRGTGLGLAGSREIIDQLGGSITVESREGKGSTFTVRLPVAPQA
jgi:signal transduction histidine kinase